MPAGAEPPLTWVSITPVVIEKVLDVKVKVPPAPVPELDVLIICWFVPIAPAAKIVILPDVALDNVFLTEVSICPVATAPVPDVVKLTVPPVPVPALDALIACWFVLIFP